MSKTHIIQLKSNNSGNQNSSFLPCQMDVSLAEPILLENGDVMQLRAAFLDFRQQGTNSIVITSDLNFTFQFYYYVVPNYTRGFDDKTENNISSSNNLLYPPIISRINTYNSLGNNDFGYSLWNGYFDDFRYYNRAITSSEASILYSSPTVGTSTTNTLISTPSPFVISFYGFSVSFLVYVTNITNNGAFFEFGNEIGRAHV